MENAADALKMAFAVFIFVFALSLAFSTITKAKDTADFVLFANDKTNYYDYENIEVGDTGRIVDISIVVSTIYRCKNETIVVKVLGEDMKPLEFEGKEAIFDSSEDQGTLSSKIQAFIKEYVADNNKYLEQYVEAKYSGKEITEDDGSTIIESKGATKMYITYTKQ